MRTGSSPFRERCLPERQQGAAWGCGGQHHRACAAIAIMEGERPMPAWQKQALREGRRRLPTMAGNGVRLRQACIHTTPLELSAARPA